MWRARKSYKKIPDIPPSENKAYVARAKELQKDLETAFLNRIDQEDKTQGS